LIYLSNDAGATWTPAYPAINTWSCVASSADGTKLVAAATITAATDGGLSLSSDGRVYVSANSGVTWASSGQRDNWKSVAVSADGTKLVAAVGSSVQSGLGRIYVSTNSGWTWQQSMESTNHWVSVASSADGTRLVAADPFGCPCGPATGRIYVSSDSRVSWSLTGASNEVWTAVASSADGTKYPNS